jgi:hypothetical protein
MLPKVLPASLAEHPYKKRYTLNLSYNVRKHIPAWKMQIPIEHGEPTRRAERAVYRARSGISAAMSSYPNGKLQPCNIPQSLIVRITGLSTLVAIAPEELQSVNTPLQRGVAFQASALLGSWKAFCTRQNSKLPRSWHNLLPRMDLRQRICG